MIGRADLLSVWSIAMTARTELVFLVFQTRAGWIVQADGFVYSPSADFADAFACAICEAKAAGDLGFASIVLTQSSAGQPCRVRWTYSIGLLPGAVSAADGIMALPPTRPRAPVSHAYNADAPQATVYDYAIDEQTKAWMVIDVASGAVARLNGVPQRDLTIDAANGMAALMNRIAGQACGAGGMT